MSNMIKMIFFISIFFSMALFAQDSGQYLDGSTFFQELEKIEVKEGDKLQYDNVQAPKDTNFSPQDLIQEEPSSSSFVPTAGGGEPVVSSDEQTLGSKRRAAKTNFGINVLFAGDTKFTGDRGTFKRTFVDDPEAVHIGPIMLGWERILGKYFFAPIVGLNAGMNFYRGRGIFPTDLTYSNANFNLWLLPLDLGFGFVIRPWDYLAIKGVAGPSVMGLIQTRSDFTANEDGKSRRQVGTGYFAMGKLQLNLSKIFPKWGLEYYRDYQASGAFLDFIARMDSYSSFQDSIEIESTRLGLGFSFDYL